MNGIQSLWYYFRLPYGDVKTQFTWPLVHAVTGFIARMTQCILGKYEDSSKKKEDSSSSGKGKTSSGKNKTGKQIIDEDVEDEGDEADSMREEIVDDEEEIVDEEDLKDDEPYDGGAFRCKEGKYTASKVSIEKVSA